MRSASGEISNRSSFRETPNKTPLARRTCPFEEWRSSARVLAEIPPDRIYHLAALTKPGANGDHRALYETNVYGTINLLEAVLAERPECPVLIAGSSARAD